MNRNDWFGIVGTVLGILGLLSSYHFYVQAKEYRAPIFIEWPWRSQLVSRERTSRAPIKVLHSDGTEITDDVHALRFTFWNAGKKSIRRADVLSPLRVTLDDPKVTILDYRVLRVSRNITNATLARVTDVSSSRSLQLDFDILEDSDGLSAELIWEGPENAPLRLSGIIEGVPRIDDHVEPDLMNVFVRALQVPMVLGGFLGGMLALTVIASLITRLFHRTPTRPADQPAGSTPTSRSSTWERLPASYRRAVGYAIASLLLILTILGLYGNAKDQLVRESKAHVPVSLDPYQ